MPDGQAMPGGRAARVPAVVLAGGRPDAAMSGGALPKAFAPLRGRSMVEFVLAALRRTSRVGRIVLVGPRDLPAGVAGGVDDAVVEQGGLLENLAAGFAGLDPAAPVLAVAADLPLLTPETIGAFVDAALATDADLRYAVVPRADVERAYPGVRKTFVRLRDGVFTGGSAFLITPRAFARARPMIERAIAARKRPWRLARLLGVSTLLGLATGRLRIDALEARVEEITGIRARAVICRDAEIAVDADRPEDLVMLARCLAARDGAFVPAGAAGPA